MCVTTGSHFCILCLLLSTWHTKADDTEVGANQQFYDDISTKSDIADPSDDLYYMEKDYFLNKLMQKYGNGVEMSYDGFEHLLHHLGLGGAIRFDHGIECHYLKNSSEFMQVHVHHNHSEGGTAQTTHCENGHDQNHDHLHDHHETEDGHTHDHETEDDHSHDHETEDSHTHDHETEDDHTHGHETEDDHTHEHAHDSGDDHAHDTGEDHTHAHAHDTGDDITHDHAHDTEDDHTHDHAHDTEDGHTHDHDTGDDHTHDHDHNEDKKNDTLDINDRTLNNKTMIQTGEKSEIDHKHHDHEHNEDFKSDIHDHADDSHDHKHTDDHEHNIENVNKNQDITTESLPNPTTTEDSHDHDHDHHDHDHDHDHDHHRRKRQIGFSECLPATSLVRIVHAGNQPRSLTKEMFKEICPSLIYQIDSDSCHSAAAHGSHDNDHDHDHDHDHASHAESSVIDFSKVPAKVWGFSTVAVIIISLVGLLGVAVIPIMQKVFYNHMLQFLVALAVGALSGDALLHLLPHAIAGGHGDEHGSHDHSDGHTHDPTPIYKGLMALIGIYFFFFTERFLTMFTEYKRKKRQVKNRKKHMKNGELVKVGERLAKTECDGMMMSIHPNKALRGYADQAHSEHCTVDFENTTMISHEHGAPGNCHEETCVDGDENVSMIRSVDSTPKSHGHGHGHSHGIDGVPNSVASVAWMVILGDGIHNFSDGLAIGAAFVNSITGGFSTSVAVFCHELPHEIGDFAMLLRAGMSPKQALLYNILSSILCFIGMLIGVAIGNLSGASLWIFSIVGGMFLYIALVDMLPELSSVETKKGEHPLCHLLLQFIGMCIGAGIMLAIALYEGDLMTLLD